MSSTSTYPVYRDAAQQLRKKGWVQKAWRIGSRSCYWQAIIDAAGKRGITLAPEEAPHPIVTEMHLHLMTVPSYRCSWNAQDVSNRTPTALDFIRWNDADGRTKAEVVSVLEKLADRLEIQELRAENRRLRRRLRSLWRVANDLRCQVVGLRASLNADRAVKEFEAQFDDSLEADEFYDVPA